MKERGLNSKVVQTDDTPVPVLDPDRARAGPDAFLKPFHGYLQPDAYSGYDAIFKDADRGITEVACMAHTRHYFFEAQTSDIRRSMVMMAYIHLLYNIERQAVLEEMNTAKRLALRRERSVPILDDMKSYLDKERTQLLPKSPIGQAISYALSNWDALIRYCEDGDLAIDNNHSERSLRGFAVGRRNWTFFGSNNGGHTAAILVTLIESAKRHHLDPFAYLRGIFQHISTHPRHELDQLLPDHWKTAQAPAS